MALEMQLQERRLKGILGQVGVAQVVAQVAVDLRSNLRTSSSNANRLPVSAYSKISSSSRRADHGPVFSASFVIVAVAADDLFPVFDGQLDMCSLPFHGK